MVVWKGGTEFGNWHVLSSGPPAGPIYPHSMTASGMVSFGVMVILFFVLPNINMCILHVFDRKGEQSLTLKQLIARHAAAEVE